MKLIKKIEDSQGHVCKFVFSDESAISEVVAYRYEDRGVVCFSCMSGCPIGCSFCGTGKKYIRNLTSVEMIDQIDVGLEWMGKRSKTQIMAMSMGEPMINHAVYDVAEYYLIVGCYFFISTVGIKNNLNKSCFGKIFSIAEKYKKFGLQISLHRGLDKERKEVLGNYPYLLEIKDLVAFANMFRIVSGNPAYFNYICHGTESIEEAQKVAEIVGDNHLTCSVLCSTESLIKGDTTAAIRFSKMCADCGVKNWSIFNPAGQDTIGGGCGQLLYVQDFFKGKQNEL